MEVEKTYLLGEHLHLRNLAALVNAAREIVKEHPSVTLGFRTNPDRDYLDPNNYKQLTLAYFGAASRNELIYIRATGSLSREVLVKIADSLGAVMEQAHQSSTMSEAGRALQNELFSPVPRPIHKKK